MLDWPQAPICNFIQHLPLNSIRCQLFDNVAVMKGEDKEFANIILKHQQVRRICAVHTHFPNLFRGKAAYTVTEVYDYLLIAQHFRDFCSGPSRTPVF